MPKLNPPVPKNFDVKDKKILSDSYYFMEEFLGEDSHGVAAGLQALIHQANEQVSVQELARYLIDEIKVSEESEELLKPIAKQLTFSELKSKIETEMKGNHGDDGFLFNEVTTFISRNLLLNRGDAIRGLGLMDLLTDGKYKETTEVELQEFFAQGDTK